MEDEAQPPEKFLERQRRKRHLAAIWAELAGLGPGMTVLDIGSGAGLLAAEYARLVGPDGIVFAVEPRYRPQEPAPNLVHLPQDAGSPIRLPRDPDVVFVTDTLHHAADPLAVLRSVRDACVPGSKILFAEYDPAQPGLVGAKPERRLARERLRTLVMTAGFVILAMMDAADEHYAMLADRGGGLRE
jgi:SAM-dependent methyltransferase